MYGYKPKSVSAELGCGTRWTPSFYRLLCVISAALCGLWRCI